MRPDGPEMNQGYNRARLAHTVEARQTCYDSPVAFTRWDPLRDLLALQERIERLADAGDVGWTPPVDLFETADAYVVTAELPGLARGDIEIHVREGEIVLQGQRPGPQVPCEQFHRVERGHGPFGRRFALPVPIDPDGTTADLKDGVLTITAPKAASSRPRRIDVA
jgi:HSP20 family protein